MHVSDYTVVWILKQKKKKVIKKDIQLKNVMQFMVYDTVHMQKFNHLVINIM
jgi:hypothetical protein